MSKGFYQQTDFASCLEGMVVLYHQLVAPSRLYQHFVVYAFEDGAGYGSRQLRGVRYIEDVDVFRGELRRPPASGRRNRCPRIQIRVRRRDGFIVYHDAVQDVAFADEVGYERVDGSL